MAYLPLNYSGIVFDFEKEYDEKSFHLWIQRRWTHCYIYAAVYVVAVFGGRELMKSRARFDLRAVLATWNAVLAVFSICGAIRTWTEFLHVINSHGVEYSLCESSYFNNPIAAFWACLFTLSKVYELGDTAFIVLRKQNLIFLHWYHHVTVLIYAWMCYIEHTAPGRWFMVLNYTIHAVMYTYYTLRALKIKLPVWINVCITSMQLMQMVVGCVVNIWTYSLKSKGVSCEQTWGNLGYASLMYISYFVLFGHFFYNTYLVDKPRAKNAKKVDSKKIS
ncbi:very long chain fatty acid elongase 6-like [Tubulanus polymorphus]|uniref:very long chain fatty acid elongase 6-like n=1 Tax=Tubulanus polymorphus TaxID=672921 RepID=UPI003DA5554A